MGIFRESGRRSLTIFKNKKWHPCFRWGGGGGGGGGIKFPIPKKKKNLKTMWMWQKGRDLSRSTPVFFSTSGG